MCSLVALREHAGSTENDRAGRQRHSRLGDCWGALRCDTRLAEPPRWDCVRYRCDLRWLVHGLELGRKRDARPRLEPPVNSDGRLAGITSRGSGPCGGERTTAAGTAASTHKTEAGRYLGYVEDRKMTDRGNGCGVFPSWKEDFVGERPSSPLYLFSVPRGGVLCWDLVDMEGLIGYGGVSSSVTGAVS